jgi:hypothetical protein
MTDFNKENLETFKTNFVNQTILPEDSLMGNFRIYDCLNWIQVMHGLRMFDTAKIKALYEKRYSELYREQCEVHVKQLLATDSSGWVRHREAIDSVKQQLKGITYTL